MPCLAPIDLCYMSIFGVKNWILRISNLILYWFCSCFVKMPCLAPIGLCYMSIFCVKNWILRISNLIFRLVLLMFRQNAMFGPYRFESQKV